MILIGLDFSTKALHLAVLKEDDEIEYVIFRAEGDQVDDRVYDLYLQLKEYLLGLKGVKAKVVCEGLIASSRHPQAVTALTKMWTLIMAASRDTGCQFQEVLPSAWKKAVLGNGKASKAESMARWGLEDDNQADARGILEYALMNQK